MRSAVDDVEGRARKDIRRLDARELSKMRIQRNSLFRRTSICHSDRHTQDRICAELAFVGRTVELDEEVINLLLLRDRKSGLDESGCNHVVDIGNCL